VKTPLPTVLLPNKELPFRFVTEPNTKMNHCCIIFSAHLRQA